jgi:hypothetical protein
MTAGDEIDEEGRAIRAEIERFRELAGQDPGRHLDDAFLVDENASTPVANSGDRSHFR